MKLVTFHAPSGGLRAGALVGDSNGSGGVIVDLATAAQASGKTEDAAVLGSVQDLLNAGQAGLDAAKRAVEFAAGRKSAGAPWSIDAAGAKLASPLPRPGKILALAGNYRAHRAEGGVASPEPEQALPEVFCKPATSVVGPDEAIKLPGLPVAATDYEGELGVVIGRTASRVSEADAMSYVAGYLCLNDVSGRSLAPGFERSPDLLARAKFFDWIIGKWCDTFCPMGPWLVTADEVADPMALTLVTRVNGEQRQITSTGEMIHSIVRTIAWCSTMMTLEPGDVIATGTPAGVGSASGRFLKDGDVVEVEINGLGILRNPVKA